MHAGEALWNLYALVTFMERNCSSDPSMLKVTALGAESCKTLAEFINVKAPDDAMLQRLVDQLQRMHVESKPKQESRTPVTRTLGGVQSAPVTSALEMCESILRDLDDLPEAADEFKEGIDDKVSGMREWIKEKNHVTDKMGAALENMRRAVDKWLSH